MDSGKNVSQEFSSTKYIFRYNNVPNRSKIYFGFIQNTMQMNSL